MSDFSEMSDELLAVQSKSDNDAMEFLIKKYNNLILARARAYFLMGGDRDDLIQEGMIGLYKAIRDFDVTIVPNFSAFADLCVKRQIITAIKSATRLKHNPLNTYISFYNHPIDDEENSLLDVLAIDTINNPENVIVSREQLKELQDRIYDSLSKMEEKVLHYYLKGMDYNEISKTMNKPLKSIDNCLQRIKNKIIIIQKG
ncbi:MAG: RNA polymerase sporulation sigma factor SigH [Clostridia bacterium]|nr:RNA polymerase sporulation sigma factor SigH [Clostridia bacterium]